MTELGEIIRDAIWVNPVQAYLGLDDDDVSENEGDLDGPAADDDDEE